MIIDLFKQAGGFEVGNDLFARVIAIHADVFGGQQLAFVFLVITNGGVYGEYIYQAAMDHFTQFILVAVALPDLVVVEVMCRRDFYTTGAKLGVNVLVGNDRDSPAGQWQIKILTQQVAIAFVAWMYGNSAVTEQGFRSGCGDNNVAGAVAARITHVPHVAAFFC